MLDQGLDLISAMLGLARGGERQPGRPTKLAALFDAIAMLLRPSMPASVQLVIEEGDPHLEVPGNVTECRQCLLNLALNAVQAMPDGGTLTLSAQRRELASGDFAEGEPGRPGPYVILSVADTGTGMDEATQARLFTPFFTSKAEGSGLGLVSCRRFVDNQQGFIRLHSRPGQGTRFDLYLPVAVEAGDGAGEGGKGSLEGQGRRVVVISDDAATRDDLIDILMLYDYQSLQPEQLGKGPPPALAIIDADTDRDGRGRAGHPVESGFRGRIPVLGEGPLPPALAPLGAIDGVWTPALARLAAARRRSVHQRRLSAGGAGRPGQERRIPATAIAGPDRIQRAGSGLAHWLAGTGTAAAPIRQPPRRTARPRRAGPRGR